MSFGDNANIPATELDAAHRTASSTVKQSLADLKVRLAEMRDKKVDATKQGLDEDLKEYAERKLEFEARHAK